MSDVCTGKGEKRGDRLSPLREKKGVCGVCGFL